MRDIYIINPVAGKRDAALNFMERVKSWHKDHGGEYELHLTKRAGHGEELARMYAESGEEIRLWVAGGDGTINEVVRGAAYHENVAVGIFPCGSGNDFVRSFGPKEVFLNFEKQSRGTTVKVDMIRSEHGDAVNICSIGFDAKVANEMTYYKGLPGVTGESAYILSLAKCLFGKIADPMTVRLWNEKGEIETYSGEFVFTLAANAKWYGGGFLGAPRAVLNDGLLEFVLIRKPALYRIPGLIPLYKSGKHLDDERLKDIVIYARGTKIEIESDRELISNMDGNCVKAHRDTFSVMPGALRLILPEGVSLP